MDTRDAWAHFDLHRGVDLGDILIAARDASYTIKILDLSVKGRVEVKGGKTELVLHPHGQRLPWTGAGPKTDTPIRIRLEGLETPKFVVYSLVK